MNTSSEQENQEVVRQLHFYMAEHNLTKGQLAEQLGIKHAQLSRWLNYRCKVSKAWIKILKIKGIV